MTRDLMEVIDISPGQEIFVEDYRMQDYGLEYNVQNEFDYRTEYLMTSRVVMEPVSVGGTLWNITDWDTDYADSLEITQSGGSLICDAGLASIGGRRYVRTDSGTISPSGTTGDDTYWIRIKYDTLTNTHSFVGESTSSPPQADTLTDKRVTLAQATKASGVWTGTPVDYRTSNTQLSPPAVITGNAGSSPILTLHQDGTGLGLLVEKGDVSIGTTTYDQELKVYGNTTKGISLYDDTNSYSVQMLATGTSTMTLQNVGGGAATLAVANVAVTSGPTLSSSGIDLNSGSITDGTWNATAITVAKGGTNISSYTTGDMLYASGATTLTKLGKGASNAVLMGGSTIPTWDSTPSVSTITATGSGSSIASSASVGGVTLNGGAISGVSTISASSSITGGYAVLTADAGTATANQIKLGNISAGGTGLEILEETGRYLQISPTSDGVYFSSSTVGTYGSFWFTQGVGIGGNLMVNDDILPIGDASDDIGSSGSSWRYVYAQTFKYDAAPDTELFDHLDDLAIIDAIGYTDKLNKQTGRPFVDYSALPSEIMDKDGYVKAGNMTNLIMGAVKQLHNKVKEQDELIGVLMDEIEVLKKEDTS